MTPSTGSSGQYRCPVRRAALLTGRGLREAKRNCPCDHDRRRGVFGLHQAGYGEVAALRGLSLEVAAATR